MSDRESHDAPGGHPSQAEGEDLSRNDDAVDPKAPGHPSQAEGPAESGSDPSEHDGA